MCLTIWTAAGLALPHSKFNSPAKASVAYLLSSVPLWDGMQQLFRKVDGWLAVTFVDKAVSWGYSSSEQQRGLWLRFTRTNKHLYLQNMSQDNMWLLSGSKQKVIPHAEAG